jgi:hypothetical protein
MRKIQNNQREQSEICPFGEEDFDRVLEQPSVFCETVLHISRRRVFM